MSGQQAPQDVYSISFRTNGTSAQSDSGWSFDVKTDAARQRPTRVQLGSMELPLQQQTVEENWCRLYFIERCYITHLNRRLTVTEQAPALDGECFQVEIVLPLECNFVVDYEWDPSNSRLRVTTAYVHGLWAGERPLIRQWDSWGESVSIVGAPFAADLNLTTALSDGRLLEGASPDTFYIVLASPPSPVPSGGGGVLSCPSPPSFAHLASVLTAAIRGVGCMSPMLSVTYDPVANVMVLASAFLEDDSVRMSVSGDMLAPMLGFSRGQQERIFRRRQQNRLTSGVIISDQQRSLLTKTQSHDAGTDESPVLKGSVITWSFVELTPGWYGPVKRSMGNGPPFPLQQEWDRQFNRFFLRPRQVGDSKDGESPLAHVVVVTTKGMIAKAVLKCGKYDPYTLATDMCTAIKSLDRNLAVSFELVPTMNGYGRFVFESLNGEVFSVIVQRGSGSIESWRIGFQDEPCEGELRYEGHPIKITDVGAPTNTANPRMAVNIYGIAEDTYQSKFKLVAQSPPPFMGEVVAVTLTSVTFTTTLQSLPAAHGYIVGQIVRICTPSRDTFELDDITVHRLDVGGMYAVVTQLYPDSQRVTMAVFTGSWRLDSSVRQVVTLRVGLEPHSFNASSTLPKALGYERLGLEARAYQYIIDGVQSFAAPFVYNLEGPDYVLIFLNDGKRNTNMIHQSLNDISNPFAKIVLYPQFREERALTRELLLSSGESFSRFTIMVRNPDGSPYEMNGAVWSFTLNFVIQG